MKTKSSEAIHSEIEAPKRSRRGPCMRLPWDDADASSDSLLSPAIENHGERIRTRKVPNVLADMLMAYETGRL